MDVYEVDKPSNDDNNIYFKNIKEHPNDQGDAPLGSLISVTLEKNANEGFGLNIVGGTDSPHILSDNSIFISTIKKDGVAFQSGRMKEGDRVISINGCLLHNCTHDEAVNAFRIAGEKAVLVIESGAEARIVSSIAKFVEMPSAILIDSNSLPSFTAQSPVLNSILNSSEKLVIPQDTALPITPDISKDDDAESVTSYAPSTHSIIDDVPRTPKRPTSLLDSKSVNVLTEVLYVSIGLGVIAVGAAVVYKFLRGKR